MFDFHKHSVNKIDAVVSGSVRLSMDGQTIDLVAGDALWVPAGAIHRAEVIGDAPVVSLDAVERGRS